MKYIVGIIVALVVIGVISSNGYFFPGDVLQNIPSFSEDGWHRPKNALQADPVYQFEPWRAFARKEIRSGRLPLWNDLNGNGAPFVANSINAVFYPLSFIYYVFPANLSIGLINCLKLFFFFYFCYLYIKSIKISTPIALLGALITSSSGYMLLWLFWPQTNVYLFLPLILYITERIREDRLRYRWYGLLSCIYFLAILGNHPETLFHILLLHASYVLFRYWRDYRTMLAIGISVIVGFFLGAMQLLPFLEYLQHSYVLENRSLVRHDFYIPAVSIVLMAIPFLFGSPHLPYYRPISQATNFQESLGGYTGLIIVLAALFGVYHIWKNSLIRFWTCIVIVSFAMAYNIWPIKYINELPLMTTSANHRLIAFVGFGLTIIFCMFLQNIISDKKNSSYRFVISDKVFGFLLLFIAVGIILVSIFLPTYMPKYSDFVPFLLWHSMFVVLSTVFFFWMLSWIVQKRISTSLFLLCTFFLVIAQTLGFFWNYNPIVEKKYFYPQTKLVSILERLPKGNIIEVGNPALPADINLKYNIPHVVNNDAVEIKWYRHAFDTAFPNRNHWGNIEFITADQIRTFHISYILSDFDIRLTKKSIASPPQEILHPLTKNSPYQAVFRPEFENVSQIRLRTATFNRNNSCQLTIQLSNAVTHQMIIEKTISCNVLRNNMFYTITVPTAQLSSGTPYKIEFTSNAKNDKNAIALWGSYGAPFVEFLYQPEEKNTIVTLLGKTNSTYIWKTNDSRLIDGVVYNILREDPKGLILDMTSQHAKSIVIKKTFYPGWEATVNGKTVPLENAQPFMKVYVHPGKSRIEIVYKPQSFLFGVSATCLTAILLCLYLCIAFITNRKS